MKTKKNLLVWTYHRILPNPGNAAISIDVFESQIEYLLSKDYNFITTEDLRLWFKKQLDQSKKYTILTFDDGWADNLFWVTPILQKYAICAVLAVNTGLIDKNSEELRHKKQYKIIESKKALEYSVYEKDKSSFLTKAELIEIKNSEVWDIQAHGNSHFGCYQNLDNIRGFYPKFTHWTMEFALGENLFEGAPRAEFTSILAKPKTSLNQNLINQLKSRNTDKERIQICKTFLNPITQKENNAEFTNRVKNDLVECKNWLKDNIGIKASAFFWPWGHYSQTGIEIAKKEGFDLLFTMEKNSITQNSSLDQLSRIAAPLTLKKFIRQEKLFSSDFRKKLRTCFYSLFKKS